MVMMDKKNEEKPAPQRQKQQTSPSFLKNIYAAIINILSGSNVERAMHKSSHEYSPKYHSGGGRKRTSRQKKQFHRQSKK